MANKCSIKIVFVDNKYFSLDEIIATNSNITCNFDINTPKEVFTLVGQRAPNTLADKGFRVGIMAWLIPAIDYNCTLVIPTVYNAVNRDVIIAGAHVANFERIQRNYYSLGIFVCWLVGGDDGRNIATTLLIAFTQRIGWIVRSSVDLSAKPKSMDEIEKSIFKIGQQTELLMYNWIRGSNDLPVKRKRNNSKFNLF